LIIVNDFRLQAAISRKWLQILESDDRLGRQWNDGFPSVPLESTQSFTWPVQRVQECTFQCAVLLWFIYLKRRVTIPPNER